MKCLNHFFLFFNLICTIAFAQKECNFLLSEPWVSQIEIAIDQRNYEFAQSQLEKLKTSNFQVKYFKNICLMQIAAEQNQLEYVDAVLKDLSKKIDNNTCKEILLRYYFTQGLYQIKTEKSDSALYYFLKAKDVAHEQQNWVYKAKALGRIAYVFNSLMNEPEKALTYNKLSIEEIKKTSREDILLLFKLNRLAYFGKLYDKTEDITYLDSVLNGAPPALYLAKKLKIPQRTGQTYSLMAGVYFVKKEFPKAIAYCDSGLFSINYQEDAKNLHALFTKKSDIYIELKNYKNALIYADSSLFYAKIQNNTLAMQSAYERLYEIEKLKGNLSQSLYYHERLKQLNDSLHEIEKVEITNELEKKYNQIQNENKIKELSHEKELSEIRTKIIIAIAIIILIIIFFIFNYKNAQAKLKILEAEQRLNRLRMNPHFFFNALASLQRFSLEDGNQAYIASYIAKLSKIMRQSLESTFTEFATLEEELVFLENYLQVQQFLNYQKFEYEIQFLNIDDPSSIKIPSMLLQPFIENSIEHGFKNMNTGRKKTNDNDCVHTVTFFFVKSSGVSLTRYCP